MATEIVDKKIELTDREMQVLGLAWQCFKTPPEIDIEKLSRLAGYSNPRSATNCLAAAKKKMAAAAGPLNSVEGGKAEPSTPSKAKKSSTPKRKAAAEGKNAADSTPSKKRGKKAQKPAELVPPAPDSEEDTKEGIKETTEEASPEEENGEQYHDMEDEPMEGEA